VKAAGVTFPVSMLERVDDRDEPGRGFTHHDGDLVRIAEPRLGALVNRVRSSESAEPWTFGIDDLYRSLARRGLLG
jgi:fumarylacetoacetate (FAA) hydrolase family protein